MGSYTIFEGFENPRRGRQARNLTTNVPKILDFKSSSEQIFSRNCRWVPLLYSLFQTPKVEETIRCERRTTTGTRFDRKVFLVQSTYNNYNFLGKSKKVRVIGSLKQITGNKEIIKWVGRECN